MATPKKALPKFGSAERELREYKAWRLRLIKQKKDTPLARRRKAEKLAQLEDAIKELGPIAAAEKVAREEAAKRAEFEANAAELRRITAQPEPEQKQENPEPSKPALSLVFDINGQTYSRSEDRKRIYPVRVTEGRDPDGQQVKVVPSIPCPVAGSELLDTGDWLTPQIKHPPVPTPPSHVDPLGAPADLRRPVPAPNPASEELLKRVCEMGYQAQIDGLSHQVVVLYDFRWITLGEWIKLMGSSYAKRLDI